MAVRILIMGLPGAGKTYLAQYVLERLQNARKKVNWLNADIVREKYNDWDFSVEGRIRQSLRMRDLADQSTADFVICDFICPLPAMRDNFSADWTVWVDTIKEGRFADTNSIFVPPEKYDFRITEQDAQRYSELVADTILAKYLYVDPTLSP
jgi:adenylylsulfate kinase